MIGSTSEPKTKPPLPTEVFLAERNSRAAVKATEDMFQRVSDLELQVRKYQVDIVQLKSQVDALQKQIAVMHGSGPTV